MKVWISRINKWYEVWGEGPKDVDFLEDLLFDVRDSKAKETFGLKKHLREGQIVEAEMEFGVKRGK